MIEIFTETVTTLHNGSQGGANLTKRIKEWKASFSPNLVKITNIHTNSNKFTYMVTIEYEIIS